MATVWKYAFEPDDYVTLRVPACARPLAFMFQGGTPCLWMLVDPSKPQADRRFRMCGTGHEITEPEASLEHIGTAQYGPLVFHLFEIKE